MATRWCKTSIGRATFKISAWNLMIGYRIDDVSTVSIGIEAIQCPKANQMHSFGDSTGLGSSIACCTRSLNSLVTLVVT